MRREIWASVTERGQVTIPAEVRRALGLGKRDKVIFSMENGVVSIKRPKLTWRDVKGSVPALETPISWDEMVEIAHEDLVEDYIRNTESERKSE
jgi:AbrB family looped-hinge helix DNA binding protein